MPDGKELFFLHGFHDLKEEDYVGQVYMAAGEKPDPVRDGKPVFEVYKSEFDQLIKVGNPLLYVQGTQPEQLPNIKADANALTDVAAIQSEAAMQASGAIMSGDANKGATGMTGVNESTVDANLRGLVLNDRGASAKAEAAKRNADRAQQLAASSKTGVSQ